MHKPHAIGCGFMKRPAFTGPRAIMAWIVRPARDRNCIPQPRVAVQTGIAGFMTPASTPAGVSADRGKFQFLKTLIGKAEAAEGEWGA